MSGALAGRRLSLLVLKRAIFRRISSLAKETPWEWRDPLSWPQWLRSIAILTPAAAVLISGAALLIAQQLPLWSAAAQSARLALQRDATQQRSYQRYLELSQAAQGQKYSLYPALAMPTRPLDAVAALAHASAVQIRQAEVSGENNQRYLSLIVEGELSALAQWLLTPSKLGAWYTTDYRIEAQQSGRFLLYLTMRWELPATVTDADREALGRRAEAQTSLAQHLIQQIISSAKTTPQPPVAPDISDQGLASEPLGSLRFRGRWRGAKGDFALLESGTGHVYRIQSGDAVGIEAAKVTAISAQGVTLTLGTANQPGEQILLTPAPRVISP